MNANTKSNTKYQNYKMWLQTFLFFYTEYLEIQDTLTTGGIVDPAFIKKITESMKRSKHELLEEKKRLGLPEKLGFLQDISFQGFAIKNGRFEGEFENVAPIVSPWFNEFNTPEGFYKYEVASYVLALCKLCTSA